MKKIVIKFYLFLLSLYKLRIYPIYRVYNYFFIILPSFLISNFINKSNEIRNKKKVVFFIMVWGEQISNLETNLLRSLMQKDNIPKLLLNEYEINFHIHLIQNESYIIKNIIQNQKLNSSINIKYFYYDKSNLIKNNAILSSINYCLEHNSSLFMALPDFFFGNGSVYNVISIGNLTNKCISAIHFRVNQNDIKLSEQSCISNSELVKLSLRFPHQNLSNSLSTSEKNSSFYTGVLINQITSNTYVVNHRLPTLFFVNFKKSDYKFFSISEFNSWDHSWPTKLFFENRLQHIGSSEIFFMAELTDPHSHLCDINNESQKFNYQYDKYFHKYLNNITLTYLVSE